MSSYDTVRFPCQKPGCQGQIDIRSKADECRLDIYAPEHVPLTIAGDIYGAQVECPICQAEYIITTHALPCVPLVLLARGQKRYVQGRYDAVRALAVGNHAEES